MPVVNPEILTWARDTAGLSVEDAASKLGFRATQKRSGVARLQALEAGDEAPSRSVLVKMASQYRRPLLTFYLPAPPLKGKRGHDFRTLPEDHSLASEALVDALIREIQARQSLIRSALEDEEETPTLNFIGSAKRSDGTDFLVKSIRTTLGLSPTSIRESESAEKAFSDLRERAESIGIFILIIGNLGSHHTSIGVESFRGFALADSIAPFVVINDQDSKAAWSFTLLHELAHLWLGETGISGERADQDTEKFCNDVASELLLPRTELRNVSLPHDPDIPLLETHINEIATAYNVSRALVAYRLYRDQRIDQDSWQNLTRRFREHWIRERETHRQRSRETDTGGPSYYVVKRHRLGQGLMRTAARLMQDGALSTYKAGQVLGVKPTQVQRLFADRSA